MSFFFSGVLDDHFGDTVDDWLRHIYDDDSDDDLDMDKYDSSSILPVTTPRNAAAEPATDSDLSERSKPESWLWRMLIMTPQYG